MTRARHVYEVLVGAGLFAVLCVLAAPAVLRAQADGDANLCLENVQAITQAFLLYQEDHEAWPPPSLALDEGGEEFESWPYLLMPYLEGGEEVFLCPTLGEPLVWPGDKSLGGGAQSGSYCYVDDGYSMVGNPDQIDWWDGNRFMYRPLERADASLVPVVLDNPCTFQGVAFGSNHGTFWQLVHGAGHNYNLAQACVHDGFAHVGFADGHVETKTRAQLAGLDGVEPLAWQLDDARADYFQEDWLGDVAMAIDMAEGGSPEAALQLVQGISTSDYEGGQLPHFLVAAELWSSNLAPELIVDLLVEAGAIREDSSGVLEWALEAACRVSSPEERLDDTLLSWAQDALEDTEPLCGRWVRGNRALTKALVFAGQLDEAASLASDWIGELEGPFGEGVLTEDRLLWAELLLYQGDVAEAYEQMELAEATPSGGFFLKQLAPTDERAQEATQLLAQIFQWQAMKDER
jgi:prepilin-type processing-associated H-X9-DG protein